MESCLRHGMSFKLIAREVDKDPSSIAKEIRGHYKVMEKKHVQYSQPSLGVTAFLTFAVPVVEMDIVEGRRGGKVLMILFFRNYSLMLAYIRQTRHLPLQTGI